MNKQVPWWQSVIYGTILVGTSTAGKIYFKKMTDEMPNYPFFLSFFINFVSVPVYFALCMMMTYYYKFTTKKKLKKAEKKRLIQAYEVPESKKKHVAKWKIMIMGGLDSLAGALMVFGSKKTSGPLQALLYQGVIPLTVVISMIVLRYRYTVWQLVGAFWVILGVIVSLYPSVSHTNQSTSNIAWVITYSAATIPTAVSSLYKEYTFKKLFANVLYLQAWTSLFQTIGSLLLFPLNLIPKIGNLHITTIPENFYHGLLCFFGHNSAPNDNCGTAFYPVLGYIICNLGFNIISLIIIKKLSTAVVYIQNAIRLPLITLLFHFHFIAGNSMVPWDRNSIYTGTGLALILAGLISFMLSKMVGDKAADEEDSSTSDQPDDNMAKYLQNRDYNSAPPAFDGAPVGPFGDDEDMRKQYEQARTDCENEERWLTATGLDTTYFLSWRK